MKILLLLAGALMMLAACAKDKVDMPPPEAQQALGGYVPHFYGVGTLDNDHRVTRGVAVRNKVWSRTSAKDDLTVKFMVTRDQYLNDPRYRSFIDSVKLYSVQWEACGGVILSLINTFS